MMARGPIPTEPAPPGPGFPHPGTSLQSMLPEQHAQLTAIIQSALAHIIPGAEPDITLERPKVAAHGDVACNVAMQAARAARRNPRELAQDLVTRIQADGRAAGLIGHAEV